MPLCPICSTETSEILREFTADQSARHFLVPELDPERYSRLQREIERLWRGANCRIVRCQSCQFVFADPYVGGSPEFYNTAYRSGNTYPQMKWEFVEAARHIRSHLKATSNFEPQVLEIGAGDGAFARMFTFDFMSASRYHATEYSEEARAKLYRLGYQVYEQSLADLPQSLNGMFDVVCMFQVLEHMDNLDAAIRRIGELCKPNALVCIAVPNDRRIAFNEANGALYDMPPNHIGRWTWRAFRRWAEPHGWRVPFHAPEPLRLRQDFVKFVYYRYRRESQRAGSLPHRIDRTGRGLTRKLGRAAYGGMLAIRSVPVFARWAIHGVGISQFAYLERGNVPEGAPLAFNEHLKMLSRITNQPPRILRDSN